MSTPLQFFTYKKNVLTSEKVPLNEITKKTGTPVYVYSADAFLKPLQELKKGLKGIDHLICFALKSNSNIAILKLLGDAGAGMDLVSGGELYRANAAKIPAERIVFSGVGKTPEEMKTALEFKKKGIYSFNVESVHELDTLSQVASQLKRKARVALRFNPDVDPKTHPYISTGLKKNKFGLNRSEIIQIVQNLKSYPGIDLRGISIHIGSQLLSLSPLDDAFSRLRTLVNSLNSTLAHPLEFVDLGGGVGISYQDEKAPSLQDYCNMIQKHFGPESRMKHPLRVLIEPGRTLSGNSGVLVTQVLYRKDRSQKDFLVVDAAMNDLIRPALYGSFHQVVPVKKTLSKKLKKTDLVGPVCESADCFASDRDLPENLQQGDLLAILSAGAYGFTMASNYNSRPRPPEVLVQDGQFKIIRERESYEDLVRREKL